MFRFDSKIHFASLIAVGLIASAVVSSRAQADDGVAGQPPAGAGTTLIQPRFDVTKGSIKMRDVPVDVQGGVFNNSAGANGLDFKASGGHDFFVFGDDKGRTTNGKEQWGVFKVMLGADGHIQIKDGNDKIVSYSVKSPSFGIGAYKWQSTYRESLSPEKLGPEQINGAMSFETVSILYDREENKPIGLKINAALLEYLKLHGQFAFRINGHNVDICGGAAGTVLLGETKVGNTTQGVITGVTATACAGIQLGDNLGNLRDELKVSYLYIGNSHNDGAYRNDPETSVVQISNTARWDNIGAKKSPFGLYVENRQEFLQSGGQNSQNTCAKTTIGGVSLRF